MTVLTQTEREARAAELRAAIRVLYPDRDDPTVLSELVTLISQLRRVEQRRGVTSEVKN